MASSHRPANAEVIAKIEAIFENIADSLLEEENPNVPRNDIFVPVKYKKRAPRITDTPSPLDAGPSDDFTKVCFPARGRPREAWRFSTRYHCQANYDDADGKASCTCSNLGTLA